jgi:hypothetical protein
MDKRKYDPLIGRERERERKEIERHKKFHVDVIRFFS